MILSCYFLGHPEDIPYNIQVALAQSTLGMILNLTFLFVLAVQKTQHILEHITP